MLSFIRNFGTRTALQKIKFYAVCLLVVFTIIACKQSYDIHKAQIVFKNLPFVKASVNNVEGYLLIDTGSSRTMLRRSIATNLHINVDTADMLHIKHFLGDIECANSKAEVKLQISTIGVNIMPYLADIDELLNTLSTILNKNVIGVLGCDYMHAVGAIVDMQHKQMFIMKSH